MCLLGGQPGQCGGNLLIRTDGRQINLGGKASVDVEAGVSLRVDRSYVLLSACYRSVPVCS
jgi:N-methylhydantoinase B/oxoprolinase/acetone carboxylase alpha subunit